MNDKLTAHDLGVNAPPRAIDTTMGDLGRTLRTIGMNPTTAERSAAAMADLFGKPSPRPSPAADAAIARIDRGVNATLAMIDAPYVDVLVAQPYLITRAVYGVHETPVWPPEGRSMARVLEDCRSQQRRAAASPSDMDVVHQLRRCRAAIEQLIAAEG